LAGLSDLITAEGLAKEAGIDARRFRSVLRRDKDMNCHELDSGWKVPQHSNEHTDMLRVLGANEEREISRRGDAARGKNP
jgi:hypothetical protein